MNRFYLKCFLLLLILTMLIISCKKKSQEDEYIKISEIRYASDLLPVRVYPKLDRDPIVIIPINGKINVVGRTKDEPIWYLVEYAGFTGWVEGMKTSSIEPLVENNLPNDNYVSLETNQNYDDMVGFDTFVGLWTVNDDDYMTIEFKQDGKCFYDRSPFSYKGYYSFNSGYKILKLDLAAIREPGQEDVFEEYSFRVEMPNENIILLSEIDSDVPLDFKIKKLKRKG